MAMLLSDIHGDSKELIEFIRYTKEKYCIQLGDFGIIFSKPEEDLYSLEYLSKILKETDKYLFTILGNHENYDFYDKLPITEFNGTKVKEVKERIMVVCRGEVLNLEGKTFLCIGGADSHDTQLRLDYQKEHNIKVWWNQETIWQEDIDNALANAEKYSNEVDYVLTHTPPAFFTYKFFETKYFSQSEERLDEVLDKVKFDTWYCGHVHEDCTVSFQDIVVTSIAQNKWIIV